MNWRKRLQFSLRTLLVLSLVCGCGMMWWFGRYRRWAAELAIPEKRDAALYNLLQAQRYHPGVRYTEDIPGNPAECSVNEVVVSRRGKDEPLYGVFRKSTYSSPGVGPGLARGHIIVFDSNGYLIPWFSAANVIDGEHGEIFHVASDDFIQCADQISCTISDDGGEEGGTVEELYVVPISPQIEPFLLVTFSRGRSKKTGWSWRVVQEKGHVEIQIGPKSKEGVIEPAARYTWSNEQRRYIGPEGGPDQPFWRLNPEKEEWLQMEQYFRSKKE